MTSSTSTRLGSRGTHGAQDSTGLGTVAESTPTLLGAVGVRTSTHGR